MSKKKMARRALFTSVISLVLCCAMLMGTTFAWFTDSVSSAKNQIQSGNLDIELEYSKDMSEGSWKTVEGATDLVNPEAKWEPGHTEVVYLRISNKGSLALNYNFNVTVADAVAGITEDGKTINLSEHLKYDVVEVTAAYTDRDAARNAVAANAKELTNYSSNGSMKAGDEPKIVALVVFMPEEVGNEANHKTGTTPPSINLGFILNATQLENEEDSFDHKYDEAAKLELPQINVEAPTASAFVKALEEGRVAKLTADVVLDQDVEIPAGVTSAIDYNGYELTVGQTGGIVVSGNLILTDGSITSTDDVPGSAYIGFQVNEGATMQIDGGTINVASGSIGIDLMGTLIMNGGEINVAEGGHGIMLNTVLDHFANIYLNGGKITGEGDSIFMQLSKVNVIDKADVLQAPIYMNGNTLNLTYYDNTKPVVESLNGAVNYTWIAKVTNSDELKTAIENKAAEIVMTPGDYSVRFTNNTAFNVDGMTITGQDGVNLSVSSSEVWYGRIQGSNVTFEDITFTGNVGATGEATYNNCTFEGQLECASSGGAKTYVNSCNVNTLHASADMNAGNVYVKESTITKAEYSGAVTMTFEGCTIGELIPWNTNTVLNKCNVTTLNAENMTTATLIIDGKYYAANADMLASAVSAGATEINLLDGEYDVYGCAGKTLTINGSEGAVLKLYNDGEDGCDYAFGGNGTGVGNVTFNGVTIDTTENTGNYKGYAYMKGTFNDCNFVGAYSLNNANDFAFNRCTFDFKNGYFWTWGAKSVTFDGCTFNGNSKCILAHGYESTVITIKSCKFAATEQGYTGSGDNTAAVEIDPAGSNTYTINFTGENTKTDSYAGWTRVKDGSTGHTITGLN